MDDRLSWSLPIKYVINKLTESENEPPLLNSCRYCEETAKIAPPGSPSSMTWMPKLKNGKDAVTISSCQGT